VEHSAFLSEGISSLSNSTPVMEKETKNKLETTATIIVNHIENLE
jgi:hypothetical protein